MSNFATKTDFFGLTTQSSNKLVCVESNENRSATTAEGHNEKGDVVAAEIFGTTMSPNCSYVLSGDLNLNTLSCGTPITGTGDYSSKKFALGGITINTAAGQPPTVDASGEEIPASVSHSDCYYTFPSCTIKQCHHAQILWDLFEQGDIDALSGCYLQQANYTAGGTISRATKDGETVSYDVTDGKLEAQVTILQTSTTKPTSLTCGSDWTQTQPFTCSNPDADYPTWTSTYVRFLTHASS